MRKAFSAVAGAVGRFLSDVFKQYCESHRKAAERGYWDIG
jgi:hypothetical protein